MGRTFHFECAHCQYQARVGGGADSGINCAVQTIVCLDCRRLFDVLTRFRLRHDEDVSPPAVTKTKSSHSHLPRQVDIPPFALVQNPWNIFAQGHRASAALPDRRWVEAALACPVAALHRVKPWSAPGRCPRCGNYLERNGLPYRLWE
jgi:hypothetical protein